MDEVHQIGKMRESLVIRRWLILSAAIAGSSVLTPAAAQPSIESESLRLGLPLVVQTSEINGIQIHYRIVGGGKEAIVLLHGFPETGDAFAPLLEALGSRFRLIIPDMRGTGQSQRPSFGYEKRTIADDIRHLLDHLKIDKTHMFGHDMGARVAYAFALQYSDRLESLAVAEAFIEGLPGTEQFRKVAPMNPRTRHFTLFADVDRAHAQYKDREEELVLTFMNERSKKRVFASKEVERYTAALKRDRGVWAAFKYYEALELDAKFVEETGSSRLTALPILAMGCRESSGESLYRQLKAAGAPIVVSRVVDDCIHWMFEENPKDAIRTYSDYLEHVRSVRVQLQH